MIVKLKKNIKSRVANGHPWIYENEIDVVEGNPNSGDIVSVFKGNSFLGKGYYNQNSLIRVRLLTKKNIEINKEFFKKKIEKALNYRRLIYPNSNTYRLIFGESDGLPGLIIDKFDDYISMQINTLGIFLRKNYIVESLIELFNPKGIYEKDDERSSKIEKFEMTNGWIYKDGPELIPFTLNGITFFADTLGQKTGFFLDQRSNALETAKYSKGKTVLDAFTYTGNFGVHCLKAGAKYVTFVDYSERSLYVLEKTLKVNNFDSSTYEIINANTFDYLRTLDSIGKLYDITIIDPPSMAKSRKVKNGAIRGYKELNLRAMKITKNGGFLSTSSCTQIIYDEEFKKIIYSAGEDTKKSLKIVFRGYQSPDHPVNLNILETEYLKHMLIKVENIENF